MKPLPIRIFLIDDHEMVRKGLRSLLETEQDLVIVGEAGSVNDGIGGIKRLHPHVVLLDIKLPDASGLEACQWLVTAMPQVRILILTSYAEDVTVAAAIRTGVHGYVLKDVRTADLIRAIRIIAQGNSYLDPRITQQALHCIRINSRPGTHSQGMDQLSPRERLIIPLLAEGKTNKEIGSRLRLSEKTIKNYIANIFDKLHMKRRTEAVAWFLKEGRSEQKNY